MRSSLGSSHRSARPSCFLSRILFFLGGFAPTPQYSRTNLLLAFALRRAVDPLPHGNVDHQRVLQLEAQPRGRARGGHLLAERALVQGLRGGQHRQRQSDAHSGRARSHDPDLRVRSRGLGLGRLSFAYSVQRDYNWIPCVGGDLVQCSVCICRVLIGACDLPLRCHDGSTSGCG